MFDKLFIALIYPLGTALLLGTLALLLALVARTARGRRWSAGLGAAALLWAYLWALPLPSFWLRGWVESDFPPTPVASVPTADAIVVLGGAIGAPRDPRQYPNLAEAGDRMWHAARLYHAGKAPLLLLSGGVTDAEFLPEAEAMQIFLKDLGVPASATLLEGRSLNTRQNAQFTADLLKARGTRQVLLVTSALHMRRAKALFEGVGLQVIPVATDHEATGGLHWHWLPEAGYLHGSGRAMKELVGRWSGR
jgi:uncharacterized SAM-binding protein YcdF (DUF218 family)